MHLVIPLSPMRRVHHALLQYPCVQTTSIRPDAREPSRSPARKDAALQEQSGGVEPSDRIDVSGEYVDRYDVSRKGVGVAEEEGKKRCSCWIWAAGMSDDPLGWLKWRQSD